jgi:hypothetical protein
VNSLSDVVLCGIGYVLARRLGFLRTAAIFLVTEAVLALWIRDGLLLNVLMLVYPVEAVKEWQAAGHWRTHYRSSHGPSAPSRVVAGGA